MLNINSGDISQDSLIQTAKPEGGVFKNRLLSLANETRDQNLSVLDEESKSNLYGRKRSLPVNSERSSMLRNKASVKDYFSTDQRFKEVFFTSG